MKTMRFFAAFAIAILTVAATVGQATAQIKLSLDHRVGNTRGWTIGISDSLDGCLAAAKYRDDTTVWFGLSKDLGPFVAFTNPRWDRIESGKKYTLRLQMGRQGTWNGAFTGIERPNEKGLITTGVKAQFFGDLARAGGVSVIFNGETITRVDLLGSRAAIEDILNCERTRPAVAASNAPKGGSQPTARSKEKGQSFGTGFFVSPRGHVLTNQHVIDGCTSFQLAHGSAAAVTARVVASDAKNDLALLATDMKPEAVPPFRLGVKVGEGISVYGFPLAGLLASTGNFTTGTVTANAGVADDTRMLQIQAPVQPGNSGGPLLDRHGNVVGVIVSKLNALRVAAVTSDLPQNINFAIKSVIAASFLESNDVSPPTTAHTTALEPTQIAERAKAFTVRVNCK
jgi:S1-C subfamily serine protease